MIDDKKVVNLEISEKKEKNDELQNDIDDLIKEVRENRKNAKIMLDTFLKTARKLDDLFPSDTDFRKKYVLENKLKTMSEIVNSELSIRKFLDDSVKAEMDLLKKFKSSNKELDLMNDIPLLAELVEKAEKKYKNIEQN